MPNPSLESLAESLSTGQLYQEDNINSVDRTETDNDMPSMYFSSPKDINKFPSIQPGPKNQYEWDVSVAETSRDPAYSYCSQITTDLVRCCHLEECMFPRFLSLDCSRLDDLSLGLTAFSKGHTRVDDTKNLGRKYIETLHFKDFLRDPVASGIVGKNGNTDVTSLASTGFQGKVNSYSKQTVSGNKRKSSGGIQSVKTSSNVKKNLSEKELKKNKALKKKLDQSQKKNSNPRQASSVAEGNSKRHHVSDKLTDSDLLSQLIFGGFEGKRSWFLASSSSVAGSYCQILPSSAVRFSNGGNSNAAGSDVLGEETQAILSKITLKGLEKYSNPSDKELNQHLLSEIRLLSMRKALRLHDHTVIFDNYISNDLENIRPKEDYELKSLESLVKPLPGYVPPAVEQDRGEPLSVVKAIEVGASKVVEAPLGEVVHKVAKGEPSCNTVNTSKPLPKENKMKPVEEMKSSKQNKSIHTPSRYDRIVHEGKGSALAANLLLESFRRNRRIYWSGDQHKCAWCPCCEHDSCGGKLSNRKAVRPKHFGMIRDNLPSTKQDFMFDDSGDSLIQCLECGLVGCGPRYLGNQKKGGQHALLHFLTSGHRFGVTCGPLSEVYCMGCGDFVYHECFDQERERSFFEQNCPNFSWEETPILRGTDPSTFVISPDHGVVWRGILATYNVPVPTQLVYASRYAAKRFSIFEGRVGDVAVDWGTQSLNLCVHRNRHSIDPTIRAPVGIFNLGNTCFMSSVLQCLVHCAPMQDLFLRGMVHPYKCCETFRFYSKNKSCMACETDKFFLEYYGSTIGIDSISAAEEQSSHDAVVSNKLIRPLHVSKQINFDAFGHPIIPSHLLSEIWKSECMKHLAGNDLNDAEYFFNAFLGRLSTQIRAYQTTFKDMRRLSCEKTDKKNCLENIGFDPIKNIFEGSLRSILVCEKCGGKRTQSESFLNVSLPLAKDFPSVTDAGTRSSPRKGKIDVELCLDHFTHLEALPDPILCPFCGIATTTKKQHTFSTLPTVLCLHLKRFETSANKKIADFISFPAFGLDMGKYLPHWREKVQGVKQDTSFKLKEQCPNVIYDLFATVNHNGTLNQGHYIAHVKNGKQWYSCNDAFVALAGDGNGEKEVLRSDGAYMLFYIRRQS